MEATIKKKPEQAGEWWMSGTSRVRLDAELTDQTQTQTHRPTLIWFPICFQHLWVTVPVHNGVNTTSREQVRGKRGTTKQRVWSSIVQHVGLTNRKGREAEAADTGGKYQQLLRRADCNRNNNNNVRGRRALDRAEHKPQLISDKTPRDCVNLLLQSFTNLIKISGDIPSTSRCYIRKNTQS